jgi:Family of unknown function (DUF6428)
MVYEQLLTALEKSPGTSIKFVLPDASHIPAHAHVTEVGHVAKNYIDCGGVTGKIDSVLLQTHVGSDTDHRLMSERFAKILRLGDRLLPHGNLPIEVEYNCCVVSQYPVTAVKRSGDYTDIILGKKRTQCLAQERAKKNAANSCCASQSCC